MNKPDSKPDAAASDDETTNQVQIRQDASGRYCLNDLHVRAGGLPKRDPSIYLGMTQTQELIMVLREEQGTGGVAPIATSDGADGLTFVADDLAIDYTMWISPELRRAVFDGFRAQRERSLGGEADITSTAEMLERAMEREKANSMRAGVTKPH